MPLHGISANVQDEIELSSMVTAPDRGSSSPNAPLLSPAADHDNDEDLAASELAYIGGRFIWVLTFSAGISGLLFGYDTGVISSTLVTIGSDLSNRPLTALDESLITSCTSLFALVASPFTGVLADKYGRRQVLLAADTLFGVGGIIQASTSQIWGMIAGRSIVGLAVGCASVATPLYISELAPAHVRGQLVTVYCLLITGGQVVAYIIGWLFSQYAGGWRWMVGLGAAPAFLQLAILLPLPETPRWLVQVGLDARALKVLTRIYHKCPNGDRIANKVLCDIKSEITEDMETSQSKDLDTMVLWLQDSYRRAQDLFHGGNRRALTIAVMLQGLQQLCGFNSLMYFSGILFKALSFSSPTLTSLTVAVTNFLFTLLAFALIDRIGRRRILLWSIPVMILALGLCAFAFSSLDISWSSGTPAHPKDNTEGQDASYPLLILLCLTVYTAAYAFGLGNVPWQQSELFPLNVRSLGSGLATATNWGSNFVVGLTFLPMMEWLSPTWTFFSYAIICTFGWIAVRAYYPEMSGLGLEEVKDLLADGWGVDGHRQDNEVHSS